MENTLLRVSGALFCHDAKRARANTDQIQLDRGLADRRLIIEPDARFGRPGPLAHKVFVAIIKKHSDYGRPIQSDVSFTRREIMRLVGRASWGGRDSAEFEGALQQIHRTFVTAHFKASSGRFIQESFNVFARILLVRRECLTDPIEQCTITLANPILASLRDDHFTCLNHTFMRELSTIAQAFYMRLFFHFANHYDGQHAKRLKFEKRYDDICAEWLGGLRVRKYQSEILSLQLGTHLEQLRLGGFLGSYAIQRAKMREGFVLNFRPGPRFFADYDHFYRRREQGEMQWRFHSDRADIAEPLKFAYRFIEKRSGKPLTDVPYVVSKELETAKRLLKDIPFEEIDEFLEFGLSKARLTDFDVQTLGGLAQYLPAYLQSRDSRHSARAAAAKREVEAKATREQEAYAAFCNAQAKAIFQALPKAEQHEIEALARTRCKGIFASSALVFELSKSQITAERHKSRLPTFAEWSAQQRAA